MFIFVKGEVLVKILVVLFNYCDIEVVNGLYNYYDKFGIFKKFLVFVLDMCGIVVFVGDDNSFWKVGDRVVLMFL